MSGRFEFESRAQCFCGASLANSPRRVLKHFAWGDVAFECCADCGSWCQSPMITADSLQQWFDSEDYQGSQRRSGIAYANYAADEANRVLESRGRYARDLGPLLKANSKVLEIGCATGSLLSVIRSHGHEVMGIDLSAKFAAGARELYGLDVVIGDVLRAALPEQGFDAVVAMGTIVNFRDLNRTFERICGLLKPGGVLVFNFPDASSAWVRLIYRQRFWMYTPSVVNFPTAKGCTAALARSGFSQTRLSNDTQQPSLRKLLHHGKLFLPLKALSAMGLADAPIPFAFPVPTVRLVSARRPHGD